MRGSKNPRINIKGINNALSKRKTSTPWCPSRVIAKLIYNPVAVNPSINEQTTQAMYIILVFKELFAVSDFDARGFGISFDSSIVCF